MKVVGGSIARFDLRQGKKVEGNVVVSSYENLFSYRLNDTFLLSHVATETEYRKRRTVPPDPYNVRVNRAVLYRSQ